MQGDQMEMTEVLEKQKFYEMIEEPVQENRTIQPVFLYDSREILLGKSMHVNVKRIYEKASIIDGRRVLVDSLWPRGVKRSTANIDVWMRDIAPTKKLRMWFAHDDKKWKTFKQRYLKELMKNKKMNDLVSMAKKSDITLLYASSNMKHNNAVVLSNILSKKLKEVRKKQLGRRVNNERLIS